MLLRPIDRTKRPSIGDGPRLQAKVAAPYWEWTEPRPAEYDIRDDIIGGGDISPSDEWDVWYDGIVLPDAVVPPADAWTEHINGTVEHVCDNGIFKITDDTPAEYLYYTYDIATLDNATGTFTDLYIKMDAASSGRNQGACLSISDGTYQFMVWLRTGTLNIDGEPKIGVDLTGWHRLQFWTRGTDCEVFVDGVSIQTGMRMDCTTEKQVAFGSWVPSPHVSRTPGMSICEWDWTRSRDLEDYLSVEEFNMALNSVSAIYNLFDFNVGDYQIVEWTHSDEEVDGVSTAKAIFEGADVLWATEAAGFLIEWLSSGSDANRVLWKVTFIGTEHVLYDEVYPRYIYGPSSLYTTPYHDKSSAVGNGQTTLTRRGQLDDAAYL